MAVLTISYAEEHFEELIERALNGDDIIIDNGDGRLVRLIPIEQHLD